jgi:hypothetical protein
MSRMAPPNAVDFSPISHRVVSGRALTSSAVTETLTGPDAPLNFAPSAYETITP